jgi:gentisate 1,2-dioxygenase
LCGPSGTRLRSALRQLTLGGEPEAQEGYRLEFLDPRTGGPVMQTVSAFAQLVPSGLETLARQTTDAAVYVVVEGEGHAWIGAEEAFQLREGDIFVVPSWAARRFAASSDLVLFSYSDRATQQKLGLWRAR